MVLLVAILLSVSVVSATDTHTNSTTTNSTSYQSVANNQAKSVTNIESNSIENKVSNEYETITNVNSTTNTNSIAKSSTTKTATKTATNTSTKKSIEIYADSITTYANQQVQINATVKYTSGGNLNNAKVAIKINNKTIANTKVSNGTINYTYNVPLMSAKKYTMTLIVGETSTSLSKTKNINFEVQRQRVRVALISVNGSAASEQTIKAIVRLANGTLADGQKAVFKLNGKTIGSTGVEKGVASISYILPVKAATYSLIVKIGESTTTFYNESTGKLVVTKITPKIKQDTITFVKTGDTITLKAVLSKLGNVNARGKVSFKVDGKTIATVKVTGNKATYEYKVNNLKVGTHVIQTVYGGSNSLNSLRVNSYLRVTNNTVSKFTYNQILKEANQTHNYILKYNKLPSYVTIGGVNVSLADYVYLLAQAVSYNTSFYTGGFSTPSSSAKTTGYDINVYKEDYIDLATKVVDSYIKNGKAQNSIKTNSNVSLSFDDSVYFFAKMVNFVYKNGRLPNYVTILKINTSSSSSSSSSSSYTSTNEVPSGYEQYLVSAKNAYVNSTTLKNAVKAATSGVTGLYNQAKAIFDYVNDKTDYSGYMNTRYGAIKTLTQGYGNCVDQGHLLLGMYRTALLPARYCHATCYFTSGLVIGHVWVEVYVNGKWYSCDTTSNRNTFGNIVNWYKSTTVKRYIECYF